MGAANGFELIADAQDGVAVTHPHLGFLGYSVQQGVGAVHVGEVGASVLPGVGGFHRSAVGLGEVLSSVAHPQHRHVSEHVGQVGPGRVLVAHAVRRTAQDDALHVVRHTFVPIPRDDVGVDIQLRTRRAMSCVYWEPKSRMRMRWCCMDVVVKRKGSWALWEDERSASGIFAPCCTHL